MNEVVAVPVAALKWLSSAHTGLSSRAIFAHMTSSGPPDFDGWSYPLDPADLGRCRRLLDATPHWRARLSEMGVHDKIWEALVQHWDELGDLMDSEVPQWRDGSGGLAPKTYQLMKKLRGVVK